MRELLISPPALLVPLALLAVPLLCRLIDYMCQRPHARPTHWLSPPYRHARRPRTFECYLDAYEWAADQRAADERDRVEAAR